MRPLRMLVLGDSITRKIKLTKDLHVTRLFVPLMFGPSLEEEADKYCHEKMVPVLEQLSAAFPHARIVIPGYLPLISARTSGASLLEVLKMIWSGDNEDGENLLPNGGAKELIEQAGISKSLREIVVRKFAFRLPLGFVILPSRPVHGGDKSFPANLGAGSA